MKSMSEEYTFTVSVLLSAPIYCRYYSLITGLRKVVIYTLCFYWLRELPARWDILLARSIAADTVH